MVVFRRSVTSYGILSFRGVVQLFNAVRQQQKTVDQTLKKAGKSEIKREKILEKINKQQFLDVLAKTVQSVPIHEDMKEEEVNYR